MSRDIADTCVSSSPLSGLLLADQHDVVLDLFLRYLDEDDDSACAPPDGKR